MTTLRQKLISRIAHCYPLLSGCGTLANSNLLQRLAGPSSEVVWGRLRNRMVARVSLDDFNGRAVYYAGDVDKKITWICTRIVRQGDTAIDVGANVGLVTLTLAGLVGDEGMVYSFDPNPALVELLQQSISRNGLKNVKLQQCAVGESNGELALSVPKGHSGRGSLVRKMRSNELNEIQVPVRPLSAMIPQTVKKIRLLKIDVEGFEAQVLRGARELFARTPPDAVLFEINDVKGPVANEPSVSFLRDLDYKFMAIPKTYLKMNVCWYESGRDRLPGHDLLACRNGCVADEIAERVQSSFWSRKLKA